LVFSSRTAAVGVAHGFEAMASPTAKFNVVKIRFRSIRFIGEAAALIPAQHQQRPFPFSEDQQLKKWVGFVCRFTQYAVGQETRRRHHTYIG